MPRIALDVDHLIERYNAGLSVKKLAQEFGVDRCVIINRLNKAGIVQRNRSEAMFLRMAQSTPEERLRLTEACHDAARGRVQAEAELIRRAEARERSKPHISPLAQSVADALASRGIPVTMEKAVGPYNIDVAFNERPVAVEIQGGNWHAYGYHGSRLSKRREYIRCSGWHLIEVWTGKAKHSAADGALIDQLVTLAESFSLDPAAFREHRVIGSDGQPVPVLKTYGYQVAPVESAERRCKRTGRYMRVTRDATGVSRDADPVGKVDPPMP